MNHSMLRPMSFRRLEQTSLYLYRRKLFLLAHPYCQVWLAEHGVAEAEALRGGGVIEVGGATAIIPLATEIHHQNKRRGRDLLDQQYWMAVSTYGHRRIEANKAWARAQGFLLDF